MPMEAPTSRRRIAVLGDTALVAGGLTDGGAIAAELVRLGVEVSFRSVAATAHAREQLDVVMRSLGIDPLLTGRDAANDPDEAVRSDLRLGDPIDIAGIFDHDVVVLAARDVTLRRFLADLPVHTRPDVRILAVLRFASGVPAGERVEDALRFDALAGTVDDFGVWGAAAEPALASGSGIDAISALHERMVGANLRAVVGWQPSGDTVVAEPRSPIARVPRPTMAADSETAWARLVAIVALAMADREPFVDAARRANAMVTAARTEGS